MVPRLYNQFYALYMIRRLIAVSVNTELHTFHAAIPNVSNVSASRKVERSEKKSGLSKPFVSTFIPHMQ